MMYDDDRPKWQSAIGRIDPFCWVAVIPMALSSIPVALIGSVPACIVLIFLAVGLLVFDSWVNRPKVASDLTARDHERQRSHRSRYPD